MVSIQKVIMKRKDSGLYDFCGLSTDRKPNEWQDLALDNGSSFLELDTGAVYLFDAEHKIWVMLSGGGGGGGALFLGNIDETTTAFPTQRPNGDELQNGDYVKVNPAATLPFTVAGIEFTSYRDLGVRVGSEWVKSSSPAQTTHETPVSNAAAESISGTSTTQAAINTENKSAINNKQDKLTAGANITIDENNVISATGGGTGAVESVNGKTGTVVLTKADLSLGNVDNTSDATKKTNFKGSITSGNTGFTVGGDVYNELQNKQATLVSGTNIKTINNNSILGSGDIAITGEPTEYLKSVTKDTENQTITITDKSGTETSFGYGAATSGVISVNGKTGEVTLVKGDLELGNVDNTSDETKKSNFTGELLADNTGFVTGGDAYRAFLEKEDKTNKATVITDTSTDMEYASAKAVFDLNFGKEDKSNKVTSITSDVTNAQYPSARSVYTELQNKQGKLTAGENITIDENNVISATPGGTTGVDSVNGKTGVVVLTKADVGLEFADNTSDATKKEWFTGTIAAGDDGFITGGNIYTALAEKQATLVSGTNIKTINGTSVLGEGDISIASGENVLIELAGMTGTFSPEEVSLLTNSPQNVSLVLDSMIYSYNERTNAAGTWQTIVNGIVYQIEVTNGNTVWSKLPNSGLELSSNKVTSISSSSTDDEYPSAKCVYDIIGNVESILDRLTIGGGV